MPERYDRQTLERLHQHLARADLELRDAQHVLNADSAEESEMNLGHDVAAARLAVTSALERVRSRLGLPSPSEATPQPGRVEPQSAVEDAQEGAQPRPWWRRIFGK
jgi:phage shock protein A